MRYRRIDLIKANISSLVKQRKYSNDPLSDFFHSLQRRPSNSLTLWFGSVNYVLTQIIIN